MQVCGYFRHTKSQARLLGCGRYNPGLMRLEGSCPMNIRMHGLCSLQHGCLVSFFPTYKRNALPHASVVVAAWGLDILWLEDSHDFLRRQNENPAFVELYDLRKCSFRLLKVLLFIVQR